MKPKKRKAKQKFDLDKAFADAERDAAKLEPWKVAFIQQVDQAFSERHKS